MPETTDDPKQGKPTHDDSASKKASSGLPKVITQLGQSGLALLLIIPAFILIGYMLIMQATAVNSAVEQVNNTMSGLQNNGGINSNTSSGIIRELSIFFQQLNTSNQNMFSIILTVFGTWVGAVVAFYFGTQNLRQSQESFNKVGDVLDNTISKMSQAPQAPEVTYKTIGDLLENERDATDVETVKMTDKIKDVKKKFTDSPYNINNVVVLGFDEDKDRDVIRGILYKDDLTEEIGATFQGTDPLDDTPLKEVIERIQKDSATNKPWKTSGINNYVELNEDNTIEEAKKKMDATGNVEVKGIVIEEELPTGIVDYQMLSS